MAAGPYELFEWNTEENSSHVLLQQTTANKSVQRKQKLSLDEDVEVKAENLFEFHAQTLTDEDLIELEKERF